MVQAWCRGCSILVWWLELLHFSQHFPSSEQSKERTLPRTQMSAQGTTLIRIHAWWLHYLRLQFWLNKMTCFMLFSQQKIPLGARSIRNVSFVSVLRQKYEAGIRRGKLPALLFPAALAACCPRHEQCLHTRGLPWAHTHASSILHAPWAL